MSIMDKIMGREETKEQIQDQALPQAQPIGAEQVKAAMETLRKYKQGKTNLERRIIDNEQWWKLRHWEQMREGAPGDIEPSSAWLVNVVLAKHADAMDSYPMPVVLPREASDKGEAQKLSSILPVIVEQNDYELTYSDVWWYKLKAGTGVTGVFWDSSKLNGLGDIAIKKVDLLNLFWEPGITNIQDSRNIFYATLVDNDILKDSYPELENVLDKSSSGLIAKYLYDDSVDVSDKSVVVDWYYKRRRNGKNVLHFVKFVGNTVLYATENEPDMAERGLYDHGEYPFVFDTLFPEEGTPCGFGYIDLCKSPQKQIDMMNNAIVQNTVAAATPRWFVRTDGNINEKEYADWTKHFVHTNGNLGEDSLRQIVVNTLPSIYVDVLNNKVAELKDTSGNRDVNNGGTSSGVTAASAIAAMQEAGGKLARDNIKSSYRAYAEVIRLCIELIRQFYDLPRTFRITGKYGTEDFIQYSNARLLPQAQMAYGVDMGMRSPVFDIEVSAQQESPYSQMAYNELAIQMFQLGFFNPQLTDQALATMEIMDFKGKDETMQRISQNGTLYRENVMLKQQLLQVAEMVDATQGTNLSDQIASAITGGGAVPAMPRGGIEKAKDAADSTDVVGETGGEPTNVANARAAAQERTRPR